MDEQKQLSPEESMTAEDALSHYIGTAGDVVAKYTHCAICGANLHFSHVTDFRRNLTQETARCPECGIKARQVLHKLQ